MINNNIPHMSWYHGQTPAAITGDRPIKRLKPSRPEYHKDITIPQRDDELQASWTSSRSHDHTRGREILDSDMESGSDVDADIFSSSVRCTDLEQALPPVKTDKEAIEEYEALQASNSAISSELCQSRGQREFVEGKNSIYVEAFNLALEAVLEEESHLFDLSELAVFAAWRGLRYEAQYLYVRLFLRKTAAWHRVDRLGYYNDIGNMDAAIGDLFAQRSLPETSEGPQPAPKEPGSPDETDLRNSFTFADNSDSHITSLKEASSLLMLDELKTLAKEAKVGGKNKSELLRALLNSSVTQPSLAFADSKGPVSDGNRVANFPPSSSVNSRGTHLFDKTMSELGKCIRLSEAPCKLFERVHLVFYRSTEWTEKSLTTIILARISRRNFPKYIVSRSSNVFLSRPLLLEFEAALRTQFRVDDILEFHGTPTRESLQTVLDIFEDIYPRWEALLAQEQQNEDNTYLSGEGAYLRRLSPAWVYTRIIHKASYVLGLGKLKDHSREHSILTKLLAQRLFHASRRGAWYQRKALLEEHYMSALSEREGRSSEDQRRHWKRIALETCGKGLEDNLVHLIYHFDLQKRVEKLEKALKVPKRLQREFGHARLAQPVKRTFEGIRIERRAQMTKPEAHQSVSSRNHQYLSSIDGLPQQSRRSTKTIWLDPSPESPPNSEVSVEAMCLSHYRSLGWKGYHSEGGILRTLFAFLFYDVLFTYVPNVFQTPYQTCPLDLHTDAFFPSRMSEINAQLANIANGLGETILVGVWEREYDRKTCVVGLDWGFELADLKSIVRSFGGEKLSTVCKILAQEYAQRGGGVPDLFLWRENKDGTQAGEVLFAEVKSENDRLSDTQRLWIHVLTNAGIQVELCNAVAKEVRVS